MHTCIYGYYIYIFIYVHDVYTYIYMHDISVYKCIYRYICVYINALIAGKTFLRQRLSRYLLVTHNSTKSSKCYCCDTKKRML